jgi:hypothetical protein
VTDGYVAPVNTDGFKTYKMPPVGKAEGCATWSCDQFKGARPPRRCAAPGGAARPPVTLWGLAAGVREQSAHWRGRGGGSSAGLRLALAAAVPARLTSPRSSRPGLCTYFA